MKKHFILHIFLGVIILFLAWLFFDESQKSKELNRTIEDLKTANTDSERIVNFLSDLDSLLEQEKYQSAAKFLENRPDDLPQSLDEFVRIQKGVIKEILSSAQASSDTVLVVEESNRPIQIEAGKAEIDSLNFVITKVRLKLRNLEEQLKQKVSGEYLVFGTTKGDQVHYVGEVEGDKANGKGIGLLSTGSRYQGTWKNNLRHGEGTFYWSDGQVYEGSYRNDLRSGYGVYYWPNGERFEGEWLEDERNGKGVFYDKDGKVLARGTWEKDEFIKVKNK